MPIKSASTRYPKLVSLPKPYLLGFMTFHGLMFLGIGYIFAQRVPAFMLLHSGFGVFVYLIFFKTSFPNIFTEVLKGAVISVLTGFIFGDFLLDNFFFLVEKPNILHKAYSALIVFYIYMYLDILRMSLFSKDTHKS